MALDMETKLAFPDFVGRDDDVEALRDAYRQVRHSGGENREAPAKRCKAVFVRGLSGTGKSALVRSALKDLAESDGNHFCEGKFDAMDSHRLFSAIFEAIDMFCREIIPPSNNTRDALTDQLLTLKVSERTWKTAQKHLPRLASLVKSTFTKDISQRSLASRSEISDDTNQSRQPTGAEDQLTPLIRASFDKMKVELCRLVKTLVGTQNILVMFIDDLQWAPVPSIDMIEELLTSLPLGNFLFVGAFRSNEVHNGDHLSSTLLAHVAPSEMCDVSEFQVEDVATFLTQSLKLDRPEITQLAQLVWDKTGGNVFHLRELLEFLQRTNLIHFSVTKRRWEWDEASMANDLLETEEAAGSIVTDKILRLRRRTIDALQLASCLGGRFDLDTLDFLLKKWWDNHLSKNCLLASFDHGEIEPTETVLWDAVQAGLLEEIASDPFALSGSVGYKFSHEMVQKAAYLLIGKSVKHFHFEVGGYLNDLYDEKCQEWMLILAADHWATCEGIIVCQNTRDVMAETSFRAAEFLKQDSDFRGAASLCRNALILLGEQNWDRKYNLSLAVFNLCAQMEFCVGDPTECERRVSAIFENAMCLEDKMTAYSVRISNQATQLRYEEAVDTGYDILRKMNLSMIPTKISKSVLNSQTKLTRRSLKCLSDKKILNLKKNKNEAVSYYIQTLVEMMQSCFMGKRPLDMIFLALRAIQMSLKHGLTCFTPPAMVLFAFVQLKDPTNFKESFRYGELAMKISHNFCSLEANAVTRFFYYFMIDWTRNSIAGVSNHLMDAYSDSLNCGSISMAALISCSITASYREGTVPLDKLASLSEGYRDTITKHGTLFALAPIRSSRQVVLNLLGRSPDPLRLEGDEIKCFDTFRTEMEGDPMGPSILRTMPLILAVFFNDMDMALPLAITNMDCWYGDFPAFLAVFYPFFHCLVFSSMYRCEKKAKFKKLFCREFKHIQQWSKYGSPNGAILALILDAEFKASFQPRARKEDIIMAFDKAIQANNKFGFVHYGALCAERAGRYFAALGSQTDAAKYLHQATAGYERWRAVGKLRQIQDDFPNLMSSS